MAITLSREAYVKFPVFQVSFPRPSRSCAGWATCLISAPSWMYGPGWTRRKNPHGRRPSPVEVRRDRLSNKPCAVGIARAR